MQFVMNVACLLLYRLWNEWTECIWRDSTLLKKPADEEPNPPVDGELNPTADEEPNPPADEELNPPADEEPNPPADEEPNPPADEEPTPPANEKPTYSTSRGRGRQSTFKYHGEHNFIIGI